MSRTMVLRLFIIGLVAVGLLRACQPAPAASANTVDPITKPTAQPAAKPAIEAVDEPPAGLGRLTADYPAEVVEAWFELELKLIQKTMGFSPPVASRALGYSGLTLYEAVVNGMPGYQSLAGQLEGLEVLNAAGMAYNWGAVANSALANAIRLYFPTAPPEYLAEVNALETQWYRAYESMDGASMARSAAYGKAVAEGIYRYSITDGGHEGFGRNFPVSYISPTGDGLWVPTSKQLIPLQPYWGNNRPFALPANDACAPAPPPEYSTDPASAFHAEAQEVYDVTTALTEEQTAIAKFWADGNLTYTPPGHSIALTTLALRTEQANLAFAAEAYAKVGMGVSDAFISVWQAKFTYNLLRPVTYINAIIDPAWKPLILTPPFPEYTSGHSGQSGAAAIILTALFGDNYAFTDTTHADLGFPDRFFGSFHEAAAEAAISRLYGGIHYRAAIELGILQGNCVGEAVLALQFTK